MDSILTSIKKMLGIAEEDKYYDPDVIMHINSVFMTLNQLGVGPASVFHIADDTSVWTDFVSDDSFPVEAIKTYVYLKVKLVFDPPNNSAVIESIHNSINELEWRINLAAESNTE